jgi:hypothetical protein
MALYNFFYRPSQLPVLGFPVTQLESYSARGIDPTAITNNGLINEMLRRSLVQSEFAQLGRDSVNALQGTTATRIQSQIDIFWSDLGLRRFLVKTHNQELTSVIANPIMRRRREHYEPTNYYSLGESRHRNFVYYGRRVVSLLNHISRYGNPQAFQTASVFVNYLPPVLDPSHFPTAYWAAFVERVRSALGLGNTFQYRELDWEDMIEVPHHLLPENFGK